ncbi:hypothetical protein D6C86_05421 [Aureobasidium pullulans]|nr:hypothetical protein D6C86_05421 [Aureobasidium pullulans]
MNFTQFFILSIIATTTGAVTRNNYYDFNSPSRSHAASPGSPRIQSSPVVGKVDKTTSASMALRKIFTKVWWSTLVHGKQAQPVPSNFFTGGNQIHRPQDVRLHTLAASTAILKARPQQSMTLNEVHESLQGSMDEIRTEIVKSKGKWYNTL